MDFDQPPVVRVEVEAGQAPGSHGWPMTIPAVAQLVREGLDLPPGVTFLVGENGSGKSTLVEAVAMAYGLSPEGGSTRTPHDTRDRVGTGPIPASAAGPRLRAVGVLPARRDHARLVHLHGLARRPARPPVPRDEPRRVVPRRAATRFDSPAFYCLDEPEAALSFSSTLGAMGALHEVAEGGGQILCATHSPVLAALPGATILELGEWGYRRTTWDELELVQHWKAYLDSPGRYLRHVLD